MTEATFSLEAIEKPSKWPSANARLLGIGAGLPVNPLDRLANFSADDFERLAGMEALKASSVIIAAIPMLVAYPFFQRYFIKGILLGAIKG